jgi:signal transduction histidine kinase
MSKSQSQPFDAVCDHLARRRPPILRAWRKAAEADPDQRTARALTLSQFNDHIPEVLDAFELQLRSRPGGPAAAAADRDQKKEEKKHGLHRWQQGYRLQELMSEWGHLQLCLFDELAAYAATHPGFTAADLVEVNRQMISMVNEAIRESAVQYERMQQAEAASHVGGLSQALERVQEIERARSVLIHQAVHDLSSNVFGVSLAANALGKTAVAETQRVEFAGILQQSVEGVTAMLSELMELARLEAGQEKREIAPFDVSALVNRLVTLNQGAARAGNLQLAVVGPRRLPVEGCRQSGAPAAKSGGQRDQIHPPGRRPRQLGRGEGQLVAEGRRHRAGPARRRGRTARREPEGGHRQRAGDGREERRHHRGKIRGAAARARDARPDPGRGGPAGRRHRTLDREAPLRAARREPGSGELA